MAPALSVFATLAVICLVALGASLWLNLQRSPRQSFGPVELGRGALNSMMVQTRPGRTAGHTAPGEPAISVLRLQSGRDTTPVSGPPSDAAGAEQLPSSARRRTHAAG